MADHEEQTSQADVVAPKGPRRPVLIAAVAGTVVIGTAVGMMLVGPMITGSSKGAPDDTTAASKAEGDHGVAPDAAGKVHVIDNMVLNPAMTSGARFLLVATAIEVTAPAIVEELKVRDAEARDVLMGVLGSRTVDQLSDLSQRDSLRVEIASAFNTMLAKPKAVRRIYFPQFVVQ